MFDTTDFPYFYTLIFFIVSLYKDIFLYVNLNQQILIQLFRNPQKAKLCQAQVKLGLAKIEIFVQLVEN